MDRRGLRSWLVASWIAASLGGGGCASSLLGLEGGLPGDLPKQHTDWVTFRTCMLPPSRGASVCGEVGALARQTPPDPAAGGLALPPEAWETDVAPSVRRALLSPAPAGPGGPSPTASDGPASFRAVPTAAGLDPETKARALTAVAVLDDPTYKRLRDWVLRTSREGTEDLASLVLDARDARRTVDRLGESVRSDGWSSLAESAAVAWEPIADASGPAAAPASERRHVEWTARVAYLTREYLRAYFRGTPLLQVKVDLKALTQRIRDEVKKKLEELDPSVDAAVIQAHVRAVLEPELRRLLGALDPKVFEGVLRAGVTGDWTGVNLDVGYDLVQGVEAPGFVSRSGDRLAFRTVQVSVGTSGPKTDWGEDDLLRVADDLLRILLEAFFDAALQVPAVATATAVGLHPDFALPKFSPVITLEGHMVTTDEFDQVNKWGARTEAGVASVLGRLVRGGGPLALNNEALAQFLVTGISVAARKSAEKVAWCYYLATDPVSPAPASLPAIKALAWEARRRREAAGGGGASGPPETTLARVAFSGLAER